MASTSLSSILARFNRYQTLAQIDDLYKIYDIDEALRETKRTRNLPFFYKKGTLRVFPDVLIYPVAEDHEYLIYLDTNNQDVTYAERMRARYTSLQQFYEDLDYRNTVAEIWNGNTLTLGIRDKNVPPGFMSGSQLIDDASSTTNYTASLDASDLTLDTVLFTGESNSSIRFVNTPSTNQALVSWTFTGFTDSDYLRKYFFVWVYLSAVPTSITMRFGADSSNYLYATATTQFSGQALVENDWNLMAFDLNTATTVGTVDTSTIFAYAAVQLNSAAAGMYNIDASYLRGWTLLDYWYVSKWAVKTSSGASASKEFFIAADGTYSTSDELVGPKEWVDLVTYAGMLRSFADKENDSMYAKVVDWYKTAVEAYDAIYADQKPLMTTQSLRFETSFGNDYPYML